MSHTMYLMLTVNCYIYIIYVILYISLYGIYIYIYILCVYIYIYTHITIYNNIYDFTAITPLSKDKGVFESFGRIIIVLLDLSDTTTLYIYIYIYISYI